MKNALEKLHETINYPDALPEGAKAFSFVVDDGDVKARLYDGKLILSRVISHDDEALQRLAAFAAGRLLREDAVLAWDERSETLILWQECPDNASAHELKSFMESFLASCDWWLERFSEINVPAPAFPDIVIRP